MATDAVGQVTTLAYGVPQDVWRIAAVTDPFGRTATFAYDEAGRLQRITDVIGLWRGARPRANPALGVSGSVPAVR